ncbi:MAG: YveK family protein [Lachnospiraceae bacterium]|jgi:capsular polysaccharide biosynthesis protein
MENEKLSAAQNNEVVEIDLGQLFRAIWKKKWLVILAALVTGIIVFAVNAFIISPTYRVSFTAYVNNHSSSENTSSLSSGDTSAAQSLTYTYAAIITSRSVLVDAANVAGVSYEDTSELSDYVSTQVQEDTQLLTVYVTMKDADLAYAYAQAIASVAPDYISDIVEGSSMKVVSDPIPAEHKYSPRTGRNTAVGLILGALFAMIYVVIRELTDNRVKNEDALAEEFGISVIGTIPDFESAGSAKEYGYYGHYYKK